MFACFFMLVIYKCMFIVVYYAGRSNNFYLPDTSVILEQFNILSSCNIMLNLPTLYLYDMCVFVNCYGIKKKKKENNARNCKSAEGFRVDIVPIRKFN